MLLVHCMKRSTVERRQSDDPAGVITQLPEGQRRRKQCGALKSELPDFYDISLLSTQVKELKARLVSKSIMLQLTPAAMDFAVSQAYDHMYGARPLRRWLEHHILTDLSRMIVTGELTEGSTVTADVDPSANPNAPGGGGALRYSVQRAPEAPAAAAADAKRARFDDPQTGLTVEDLDDMED